MKDINLSIIAFRREIKKKMDEGTKNCIYSTHQTSCHLYLIWKKKNTLLGSIFFDSKEQKQDQGYKKQ